MAKSPGACELYMTEFEVFHCDVHSYDHAGIEKSGKKQKTGLF